MLEPETLAAQAECLTVSQVRQLLTNQPDDALMLIRTADGKLLHVSSVTRQLLAESNPPRALDEDDVEHASPRDFCCDFHHRQWEERQLENATNSATVGICLGEAPTPENLDND